MKKSKSKINIGLQILRFLLCFWIVINHLTKKLIARLFHVPSFALLAFYFYFPLLEKRDVSKIIIRFQRLLIPYVFYPILIFILNNIPISSLQLKYFNYILPVKYLYLQLLIASTYYQIFWFQFNLIFLSLAFAIISFIFKKNYLEIFQFFGVLSLYLNISKKWYNIFIYTPKDIRENIGSLLEIMPFASIGCILGSINLLQKLNKIRLSYRLSLLFLIFLFFKYDIFINLTGFRYPNIFLNILATITLFLFFATLQLDKPKIIKEIILLITQYTGGIYYMHIMIRNYLSKNLIFVKEKTYFTAVFIYFVCYCICFIGHKIFKNNNLKYLFI